MFRGDKPYTLSRLAPALLFVIAGCAPIPDTVRNLPQGSVIELDHTPFFPQEQFQCGPAALATVLSTSGVAVTPDDLVHKVYLPGRKGSLQLELLAATRTEGRLPFVIDGTMSAIREELWAGRPVLVLQNLGIAAIPGWHYAVVIGIDTVQDEVVLRSGTERRRVMETGTFLRTWRRGEYWAMVALRPDELPASADRARYFEAIAALEEAGQFAVAEQAWRNAAQYWPDDPVVLFGLGNAHLALEDFAAAERYYRTLLETQATAPVARNNLALALAGQGAFDAALAEIDLALAETADAALVAELRDTERRIRERAAQ